MLLKQQRFKEYKDPMVPYFDTNKLPDPNAKREVKIEE
jgi:hypothetical protein